MLIVFLLVFSVAENPLNKMISSILCLIYCKVH